MRTAFTVVGLFTVLTGASGCTIAKQGFWEIRGAKAEVLFVDSVADDALAEYQALIFSPATTTVGDSICPPDLLRGFDTKMAELVKDLEDLYPGGTPRLRITLEVLYFTKKGLTSSAECLARVKFHNEQEVVVDTVVVGASKAFSAGDADALAEACVQAIREFLEGQKGLEEEDNEEADDEDEEAEGDD